MGESIFTVIIYMQDDVTWSSRQTDIEVDNIKQQMGCDENAFLICDTGVFKKSLINKIFITEVHS